MGPALRNLVIYRGDTYDISFRLRTRTLDPTTGLFVDGAYVNHTGSTAKSEIRTAAGDLVVAFTCTIPDQAVAANVGRVDLTLSPTQTADLPVRAATALDLWDFQITTSAGRRKTYLKGTVTYDGEVTLL